MKQINCQVAGCRNFGRYCRVHQQETFKPSEPVKKVGDSMKEKLKEYRVAAKRFITRNRVCKLKMDGCEIEAKCVHHTKGREGDLLLDEKFWLPSCYHCNLQVEIRDAEARSKNLKLSKFNTHATSA